MICVNIDKNLSDELFRKTEGQLYRYYRYKSKIQKQKRKVEILEQQIQDLDNQMRNVHLKGFVPNEEVQEIIAQSAALILPTQVYEGFPMTIVEAYGKGTPVIASDLGNAGNLVISGITGKRFSYQSAEALADAVRNFEIYDSAQIREIYQEKYSAEKNYEELQRIYEHVSHKES